MKRPAWGVFFDFFSPLIALIFTNLNGSKILKIMIQTILTTEITKENHKENKARTLNLYRRGRKVHGTKQET
jgi:hypothetical protein